jgi:4-hydroxy-4-methyl-2-oxoglutarate aldolase
MNALEALRTRLHTNVVGDVLDKLGYEHQFLPAPIRSIGDPGIVVGRAMPVLMIDVYGPQEQPFGLLTEALDQLQPDDVYLATGGLHRCAYWGEILTEVSRQRGAAGAVIDGYHRDTRGVLARNWPVFSRGSFGQDSSVRTQVTNYRCRVELGGVNVEPGDIVFGDIDGVVVIPRAIEDDVIAGALDKVSGERTVLNEIANGLTSTEAFARHGIL